MTQVFIYRRILILIFFLSFNAQAGFVDWLHSRLGISIPPESDSKSMIVSGLSHENMISTRQLSILQWNILKAERNKFSSDFENLIRNRDLVLLQESISENPLKELWAKASFEWSMAVSFYREKVANGVATGSRFMAQTRLNLKTEDVENITYTPKVSLVTTYNIEGREDKLMVVNVHAMLAVGAETFANQIERIYRVVERHNGPVIVAGDFNTWGLGKKKILDQYMRLNGLEQVKFMNDPRPYDSTTGSGSFNPYKVKLDHVYTRGFIVKQAHILGWKKSSDHYPLWYVLEFKPKE